MLKQASKFILGFTLGAALPVMAQSGTIQRGSASVVRAITGSSSAPPISFAAEPGFGFFRYANSSLLLTGPAGGLTPIIAFGDTTSSSPAVRKNGTTLEIIKADASAYTTIGVSGVGYKTTGGSASAFVINNTATPDLFQFTNNTNTTGIEVNTAAVTLGACGTSPTLGSKSTATGGNVISGSATTTCVVNFSVRNWTNTPNCVVTDNTTTGGAKVTASSVSSFTVTLTASDAFTYHCDGTQ